MVDQKYRIDGNIVLSAGTRLRRVWTSPLWLNKPKPWHGYVVTSCLISHPYGDSLAPYLGTAILTILCFLYLLDNVQIQRLIGQLSALG